jgi:hypothetical protein
MSEAIAQRWIEAGVTDPEEAVLWSLAKETPTSFVAWRDAGFTARDALSWRRFGHDPTSAKAARDAGDKPATSAPAHGAASTFAAARRIQSAFDMARMEQLGRGSVEETEAKAFLRAVVGRLETPAELQRFMGVALSYVAVPWTDDEAVLWAQAGFPALEALDWKALGIGVVDAASQADQGQRPATTAVAWLSAGVPVEEVGAWLGAGLTPGEAAAQRRAGVTAEHATILKALR